MSLVSLYLKLMKDLILFPLITDKLQTLLINSELKILFFKKNLLNKYPKKLKV